jgi:hypothetical protein
MGAKVGHSALVAPTWFAAKSQNQSCEISCEISVAWEQAFARALLVISGPVVDALHPPLS